MKTSNIVKVILTGLVGLGAVGCGTKEAKKPDKVDQTAQHPLEDDQNAKEKNIDSLPITKMIFEGDSVGVVDDVLMNFDRGMATTPVLVELRDKDGHPLITESPKRRQEVTDLTEDLMVLWRDYSDESSPEGYLIRKSDGVVWWIYGDGNPNSYWGFFALDEIQVREHGDTTRIFYKTKLHQSSNGGDSLSMVTVPKEGEEIYQRRLVDGEFEDFYVLGTDSIIVKKHDSAVTLYDLDEKKLKVHALPDEKVFFVDGFAYQSLNGNMRYSKDGISWSEVAWEGADLSDLRWVAKIGDRIVLLDYLEVYIFDSSHNYESQTYLPNRIDNYDERFLAVDQGLLIANYSLQILRFEGNSLTFENTGSIFVNGRAERATYSDDQYKIWSNIDDVNQSEVLTLGREGDVLVEISRETNGEYSPQRRPLVPVGNIYDGL